MEAPWVRKKGLRIKKINEDEEGKTIKDSIRIISERGWVCYRFREIVVTEQGRRCSAQWS
jgi:hypothetical protein